MADTVFGRFGRLCARRACAERRPLGRRPSTKPTRQVRPHAGRRLLPDSQYIDLPTQLWNSYLAHLASNLLHIPFQLRVRHVLGVPFDISLAVSTSLVVNGAPRLPTFTRNNPVASNV